jgi:hypothetical protein
MRLLLGMILGALLIVTATFIADSVATGEAGVGAEPRPIVNWDVASDRLHEFTAYVRAGWNKLTR